MVGRDRRARRIACAIVGRPQSRKSIPDIRVIREFPTFCVTHRKFYGYLSERPEMTSHGGKPRKAKNNERKLSYEK